MSTTKRISKKTLRRRLEGFCFLHTVMQRWDVKESSKQTFPFFLEKKKNEQNKSAKSFRINPLFLFLLFSDSKVCRVDFHRRLCLRRHWGYTCHRQHGIILGRIPRCDQALVRVGHALWPEQCPVESFEQVACSIQGCEEVCCVCVCVVCVCVCMCACVCVCVCDTLLFLPLRLLPLTNNHADHCRENSILWKLFWIWWVALKENKKKNNNNNNVNNNNFFPSLQLKTPCREFLSVLNCFLTLLQILKSSLWISTSQTMYDFKKKLYISRQFSRRFCSLSQNYLFVIFF